MDNEQHRQERKREERFRRVRCKDAVEESRYVYRSFPRRLGEELKGSRAAMASLVTLCVIVAAVLMAPLCPWDPDQIDVMSKLQPPGAGHIFGTDDLGRDYFSRALHGGRISLLVGIFSMAASTVFGTAWGTVSGYMGGAVDAAMMRVVDIMMSIPSFLLLIILNAFIAPGLFTMVLMISMFSWMNLARITRAETMTLKQRDYILAARCLGESRLQIVFRHIVPNMLPTIVVSASLSIANAILTESSLSFLGFGVQMPMSSWGNMLQGAQSHILDRPYLAVFPGALILITVMCFNVLGDFLRHVAESE